MLLDLAERLTVMDMLPNEDSLVMMKIMHNLRMDLAPTDDEVTLVNLRLEPIPGMPDRASYLWEKENEFPPIDVKMGVKAQAAIVLLLEALDTGKKIQPRHFTLCEKFGIGED